jgi:thiosulfate dehydrogenase (quinone) large subunit
MNNHSPSTLGPALGVLLLRLWLGVRGIVTGLEKFAGNRVSDQSVVIEGQPNTYGLTDAASSKFYALTNYHGIPPGLLGQFKSEPLIPGFLLPAYDVVIGPAFLLLGLALVLGVLPRISLFLTGLLYTSLTVGLILIRQDAGVAWLAVHVLLVALALMFSDRDRFALAGKRW